MNFEHQIVRQVYEAKEDMQAADRLISSYMPFIRSETGKFLKRPPADGEDDELSIAMIAFHEAIRGYSRLRGSFLKYAALTIKSRLIDYSRRESRHTGLLSLDAPADDDGGTALEHLPDTSGTGTDLMIREATLHEIEELRLQMEDYGVTLTDVAENSPRQQRTLAACQKALLYAKNNPELMEEFLRTKRLPIARLAAGTGTERKMLERHRKYLVALLLIWSNGYEIIRGHLAQVLKGGAA